MYSRHLLTLGEDHYIIDVYPKYGLDKFYVEVYALHGSVKVNVFTNNWPGKLSPAPELARIKGEYEATRDHHERLERAA